MPKVHICNLDAPKHPLFNNQSHERLTGHRPLGHSEEHAAEDRNLRK